MNTVNVDQQYKEVAGKLFNFLLLEGIIIPFMLLEYLDFV